LNAFELDERGVINPSTLAILKDGYDFLWSDSIESLRGIIPIGIFIVIAIGISIISFRSIRQLNKKEWLEKRKVIIFLSCLTYSLIMPRFKTYSYILLLVPSYYILWRINESQGTTYVNLSKYFYIAVFTCLSSLYAISIGSEVVKQSVLSYSSLFAAYYVWGMYIWTISRMNSSESTQLHKGFRIRDKWKFLIN
jgi:hypothetical protein